MKGVQKNFFQTSIQFITFWGLKEKGQNVLLVSQWMYIPSRLRKVCGGYRRWGGSGATKMGVPPTQCMQCLRKRTHFSSHGFLESYHTLEYVSSTHHVSSAQPNPYSSCENSCTRLKGVYQGSTHYKSLEQQPFGYGLTFSWSINFSMLSLPSVSSQRLLKDAQSTSLGYIAVLTIKL